ncbi:hypothetical protein F5Y13DRAFT_172952 [Hypoxylon sp. FL1857]|nr:hypothetical protein F5Y13DRAFT_172952 [Hypoxylon sp. FL1857]
MALALLGLTCFVIWMSILIYEGIDHHCISVVTHFYPLCIMSNSHLHGHINAIIRSFQFSREALTSFIHAWLPSSATRDIRCHQE